METGPDSREKVSAELKISIEASTLQIPLENMNHNSLHYIRHEDMHESFQLKVGKPPISPYVQLGSTFMPK
jgi:hypothetical protein